MSETDSEASASHAYFRAIEETFVRLRGAPLLLSPSDWQVAKLWHDQGIPLAVVREALEEVFARRKQKGARGRIQSLRYCAETVEQHWQQIQDLKAPGVRRGAPPIDVQGRLQALAKALPPGLDGRPGWAERIRGLSGSASEVEQQLAGLDTEMLSAVEASLDEGARQDLASSIETALARLADRADPDEIDLIRSRLTSEVMRRKRDLPVLSLFSAEAQAGENVE